MQILQTFLENYNILTPIQCIIIMFSNGIDQEIYGLV